MIKKEERERGGKGRRGKGRRGEGRRGEGRRVGWLGERRMTGGEEKRRGLYGRVSI